MTMPKIEVRQLEGGELIEVLYQLASYAFHASPPMQNKQEWLDWMGKAKGIVSFATFEDGVPMANALSHAMTENVRGRIFPMFGVWGVATHPLARRKGYCRQAMAALMEHEHKAGRIFSCLYPFKESFYERMGYVAFPKALKVTLDPRQLLPLLKIPLPGRLEMLGLADGYDLYNDFLAERQKHVHGMALFDHPNKEDAIKDNRFWVVTARLDGRLEGAMLYGNRAFKPGSPPPEPMKLCANRMYANSRAAYYLLLSWIARHADQMQLAEIDLQPGEDPTTWLSDLDLKVEYVFPPGMGRVMDIPGMSGLHVGEGSFTAEVSDPFCSWNEGVWRLSDENGKLAVAKVEKAQCTLTIQGLSAIVYGTNDPGDLHAHAWGDVDERTAEAMRALFPKVTPYMHSKF
jgi:predicted acetyltransferase